MKADSSPSTRDRILAIADRLFDGKDAQQATLVEIARAASVSRQTLYLLFGDRLGLMTALWRRRLGVEAASLPMYEALKLPALEAFDGFFRNWIRHSIRMERSMRPVLSVVDADPELLSVVRKSDEGFRARYRQLFEKVHEARHLRDIWTVEEAVDSAWQTTMYLTFVGHVRNMRGWSPIEIEERGIRVLRATFLKEDAARETARALPAARRVRHNRVPKTKVDSMPSKKHR
jgi:AcrR family transcriptional regulator